MTRPPLLLTDLARLHGLELTRFAFLVTGDRGRAEDLVQDALLAMHRRFGAQLSLEDPLAYARRAIVNGHLSWLRRRLRLEYLVSRFPDAAAATADPWSGADRDDSGVVAALTALPPRQRIVLVLRYYVGHSDAEIAALLGCREGSVRSLAARAFASLRPVLRPAPAAEPSR